MEVSTKEEERSLTLDARAKIKIDNQEQKHLDGLSKSQQTYHKTYFQFRVGGEMTVDPRHIFGLSHKIIIPSTIRQRKLLVYPRTPRCTSLHHKQ
jgi:hypothetical protein